MASVKGKITTVWAQENRFRVKVDGDDPYLNLKTNHPAFDSVVATAIAALSTNARVQVFFDGTTIKSIAASLNNE